METASPTNESKCHTACFEVLHGSDANLIINFFIEKNLISDDGGCYAETEVGSEETRLSKIKERQNRRLKEISSMLNIWISGSANGSECAVKQRPIRTKWDRRRNLIHISTQTLQYL